MPRLAKGSHDSKYIPWDIVSDATALLARWRNCKYDVELLRGVLIEKKSKSIYYKSDPGYEFQRVSAAEYGDNGLVNGQWWPNRQCTLRDGAHGEVEAGIHGKLGKGVFSIVLANGGYADRDEGEVSPLAQP